MAQPQSITTTQNPLLVSHTQLWIGNHDAIIPHIQTLLEKTLCPQHGCNTCNTCLQIRDHQHHAIMWLYPERTYTKSQFDELFHTASFALEPGALFFFIIQKADFLTPASANRLLKILEEPPSGYHFILTAERIDQLLPTIVSRCFVHEFKSDADKKRHPLFNFFTKMPASNPVEFLKVLDQSKINERESVELMDDLLKYWIGVYKKKPQNQSAQKALEALKTGFKQLPMPGSSKLFWKDIYLRLS